MRSEDIIAAEITNAQTISGIVWMHAKNTSLFDAVIQGVPLLAGDSVTIDPTLKGSNSFNISVDGTGSSLTVWYLPHEAST